MKIALALVLLTAKGSHWMVASHECIMAVTFDCKWKSL